MAKTTTTTDNLKASQFAFINITNPKDLTRADNQRTIRRHAWDAGRPHGRRRRRNYTFDLSSFYLPAVNSASIVPVQQVDNDREHQKHETSKIGFKEAEMVPHDQYPPIDYIRPLGAGRGLDPLAPFPVPSNPRIVQLIDFAQKDSKQMRVIWISVGMSDRSAFQLSLASSAFFMARQNDPQVQENTESLGYYTAALSSVNGRLLDPTESTSEGLIGAILGFCCYDCTVRQNLPRLQIHLDGLERVVQSRGGIETLRSAPLRIMLTWLDVLGSMLLDSHPRFPVPKEFVRIPSVMQQSSRLAANIKMWNDMFPSFKDISNVLQSVASLSSEINNAAANPQFWGDESFIGVMVNPVTHQLLLLPHLDLPERTESTFDQGIFIREIIRLASMVFLGLLRRQFDTQPDGIPKYGRQLTHLLKTYSFNCYPFTNLYLWALIISTVIGEDRGALVARIVEVMSDIGVVDWDNALAMIKEIAWVDEAAAPVIHDVGVEVIFHMQIVMERTHGVKHV
ncbi:hypothetical protein AOQ84DRAFT_353898 [Glonium stellatum]|uniref:Uncharacterized protein n=1 Tax=Glonium stellatum TaxID=574774 RepID=A0A8E2F358_9PEZI|nr:hypothetical protein AOQ84DRAFT_353898 [Glonium stellatum]